MLSFIFVLLIGFYSFQAGAKTVTCATEKKVESGGAGDKPVFCFFSLNNVKEKEKFTKKYGSDVVVREFYGTKGTSQSVQARFKAMLQTTKCDSLVISGHHTGYFTGKESIAGKNPDWSLDLDFMEDMSCEPGCEDWFSHVKSLFLMGCQTVEPVKMRDDKIDSADSETIRIISKELFTSYGLNQTINQAFSSTLDQNTRLSHRYLRMFPESSLYGWGAIAPGDQAGSENSLPNFIDRVQSLRADEAKADTDNQVTEALNFLNLMNRPENTCHQYSELAGEWALHWRDREGEVVTESMATSCFLQADSADKKKFKEYQALGCALTKALKEGDQTKIKNAVQKILESGPDGIRANFNRLMSLVTNKDNHGQDWYQQVRAQLKQNSALESTVVGGIRSSKAGFVRKSDYLYFYKELYAGNNLTRDKELSQLFVRQLHNTFDTGSEKLVGDKSKFAKEAYHHAVFESMAQNQLGDWLYRQDRRGIQELQDKFKNSSMTLNQILGYSFNYWTEDKAKVTKADNVLRNVLSQIKENYNQAVWLEYRDRFCRYRESVSSPCPF